IGSGRSVEGFDVVKAMETASHALERFGGHPQACGLTIIGEEHYQEFKRCMEAYAGKELAGRDMRPVINVECELTTGQITWDLIAELERFAPYGEGNPKPTFVLRNLMVTTIDYMGKTKAHARIGVDRKSTRLNSS